MDRFPFSFPNGWFQAMYSDDLAVGEVKSVRYHARDLVLFRDEEGQPALLDAHCPHLGAHLGVGGRVVGEALRCPFHGWEWAGDGRCVGIPYAKRIPANARVGSYPTVEKNGVIYFWYHAEGEAPSFEIPLLPEVADPDFTSPWSRTEWTIRTHPQEILENGVDFQHLTLPQSSEHPCLSGRGVFMNHSGHHSGCASSMTKDSNLVTRGIHEH